MSFDVILRDATGEPLNARVEADERGLVIHSRSGTDRNRDYRQAVEVILSRLDAAGVYYEVYFDSAPVQHQPIAARRLAFTRGGPLSERFNTLVRAMNAGSSSNGAWRRILIAADGHEPAALAATVQRAPAPVARDSRRLSAAELRRVTHAHVDNAVSRLLLGYVRLAPIPDSHPQTDV